MIILGWSVYHYPNLADLCTLAIYVLLWNMLPIVRERWVDPFPLSLAPFTTSSTHSQASFSLYTYSPSTLIILDGFAKCSLLVKRPKSKMMTCSPPHLSPRARLFPGAHFLQVEHSKNECHYGIGQEVRINHLNTPHT